MTTPKLSRFALPALAFATGYLALWFVWGVPWPWLLPLALAGALAWAWAEGGGVTGLLGFGRAAFGWTLAGLTLWWVGAVIVFSDITLSGAAPHFPIGFPHVVMLAIPPAFILAFLWWAWKNASGTVRGSPLAPWLWLAGLLSLFLLPPVRIDCRGMMETDAYIGYSGLPQFREVDTPSDWNTRAQIPDSHELPEDFEAVSRDVSAAQCTRPFSFRPSQPLIVVFLEDRERGGTRGDFYSAAFSTPEHQKLTRWTLTSHASRFGHSYTEVTLKFQPTLQLSPLYPVRRNVPPELEAELGGRSGVK